MEFYDIIEIHSRHSDWNVQKINFQKWKNCNKKSKFTNYFLNPRFGALYVLSLYRSRQDTFYSALNTLESRYPSCLNLIKSSTQITSIGCGPGPEIAAYIHYIYFKFIQNVSNLKFTAIDAISHWEPYLNKLAGYGCTIDFKNTIFNRNYALSISPSDICLISFCDAANFNPDIWRILKLKFKLIIITEVNHEKLHKKLKANKFFIIDHGYNKRIYVYFEPNDIFEPFQQSGSNFRNNFEDGFLNSREMLGTSTRYVQAFEYPEFPLFNFSTKRKRKRRNKKRKR